MDLFFSGELGRKLPKNYRAIVQQIKEGIEELLNNNNYGNGLNGWNYISIILPQEFIKDYPEIKKYHKKNKEVEFRLQIDYDKMKLAEDRTVYYLFCNSLLRSVSLFEEVGVKDFEIEKFYKDLKQLFTSNGWLY